MGQTPVRSHNGGSNIMEIQRHTFVASSANARRVLARAIRPASHARLGAVVGEGLWLCAPAQDEAGAAPLVGADGQTFAVRPLADPGDCADPASVLLVRARSVAALAAAVAALRTRLPGATIIGVLPDALATDVIAPLRAGADDVFGTGMMTAEALARIQAIARRHALARAHAAPRSAPAVRLTLVG
ncbi:MAG: hypothetical protein IH997_02605 [Proteobacteria bacterium]|nr:hypothetical protein [Pseudomonadota bacterium]